MAANGIEIVLSMLRMTRSDPVAHSRGRSIADQASTPTKRAPHAAYGAMPWSPGHSPITATTTTKVTAREPVIRPLVGRNLSTTSSATPRLLLVCGPPTAPPYAGGVSSPTAAPPAAGSSSTSVWDFSEITRSDASLRRFLHGLPGVDQVGAEARAAVLGTRSIKTTAKEFAIDLAIRMVDLTTLEGQDTHGKVRALAAKAMHPDPADPTCPSTAAICVYPDMVGTAKEVLGDSGVNIAAVATAFPSGRAAMDIKIADTKDAVEAGADEIDMVIDRGAFLSGRYLQVFEEIAAIKEAAGDAHLKVIMETGELQTYDNVRRASWLSMMAGGHFIKTSTGKVQPAATLPVTLIMLEAVRDFREATGQMVGVKPAGGIRTSKDAIKYLVMVNEVAGPDWLDPDWFRFGASTLLNDLLMQRTKMRTGRYSGPDYFTLD